MRVSHYMAIVVLSCMLSACGGGTIKTQSTGQSGKTSSSTSTAGGSSSTTSGGTTSGGTTSNNVAPLVVDSGPAGLVRRDVDMPFTTIILCDEATPANCQTIDHILVDTGSTGLRILASVLSPSLKFVHETDASARDLGECTMFISGYIWGPVVQANLRIAGEESGNMPVQLIGDATFSGVPSTCANAGSTQSLNTIEAFGAKGLIGVGNLKQDCGKHCASNSGNDIYYACSNNSCSSTTVSLAQQIPNPVSRFAVDNNGVILSLPAISKSGAPSVNGSMIFGINTQSNNQLNGATIMTLDPVSGFLATVFDKTTLCDSFIDSGSNALYFPVSTSSMSASLPNCASGSIFYCPPATQNLTAQLGGINGATKSVNFSVTNFNNLLSGTYSAFNDIAGGNTYGNYSYTGCSGTSNSFDWGLPFFFGRDVYIAFNNENVGGSTGPFVAF